MVRFNYNFTYIEKNCQYLCIFKVSESTQIKKKYYCISNYYGHLLPYL